MEEPPLDSSLTSIAHEHVRRRFLIDPAFQWEEIRWNAGLTVLLLLLQVALAFVIGQHFLYGTLERETAFLLFLAILIGTPLFILVLRLAFSLRRSHRIAGACYRLLCDLRHFPADPSFRFHLREGDYLHPIATELNRVMERWAFERTTIREAIQRIEALHQRLSETREEAVRPLTAEVETILSLLRTTFGNGNAEGRLASSSPQGRKENHGNQEGTPTAVA